MSSTELTFDPREISFVLDEWLDAGSLSRFKAYEDFDAETIALLVQESQTFSKEVMHPTSAPADREGCRVEDNRAKVPECMHEAYQQAYELGWATMGVSQAYGGQGASQLANLAVKEGVIAAHPSLAACFTLTEGVVRLVDSFGTPEIKETYLPRFVTGEFSGTMCLSEPHAGSDVGANSSTAEALGDGRYRIKGTKCWITGGDTDLSKNVIHTVLARIKGAPEGTKGLSLFLVPASRLNDDGSIGESNDVTLASIEHKMGLNASPTCVLNFGENNDCYGYLLGGENQGISHMFQLMNDARLATAAVGLSIGSAAYHNSLSYAKERVQGVRISEAGKADAEKVAIIEHPDVRLSLSTMKAKMEASRALLYATMKMLDLELASDDAKEREENAMMVQLLTPMCKAWITEVGIDVVRQGIQVLGGVGYTRDFPLEQAYRDLRVAAIYEGTTGIQALDLVGRKMTQNNGALFMNLMKQFNDLAVAHKDHDTLSELIQLWSKSGEHMAEAAMGIKDLMDRHGLEGAALYATPFMMGASAVTAGYYLLDQCLVAAKKLEQLRQEHQAVSDEAYQKLLKENSNATFYDNKIKTTRFYLNVVLPTFTSGFEGIKRKNLDPLNLSL